MPWPTPPTPHNHPFKFLPVGTVHLWWLDPDTVEEITVLDQPIQWLPTFITIGAARERIVALDEGTGLFFSSPEFIRRCVIKTDAPIGGLPEFRFDTPFVPAIITAENRRYHIVDSMLSLDPDDEEGPPLWTCFLARSQSTDE